MKQPILKSGQAARKLNTDYANHLSATIPAGITHDLLCYPGISAGICRKTFSCATAVILQGDASSSLGIAVLPGNNDLSQVTGACIRQD
jgi:hypothetical protein